MSELALQARSLRPSLGGSLLKGLWPLVAGIALAMLVAPKNQTENLLGAYKIEVLPFTIVLTSDPSVILLDLRELEIEGKSLRLVIFGEESAASAAVRDGSGNLMKETSFLILEQDCDASAEQCTATVTPWEF